MFNEVWENLQEIFPDKSLSSSVIFTVISCLLPRLIKFDAFQSDEVVNRRAAGYTLFQLITAGNLSYVESRAPAPQLQNKDVRICSQVLLYYFPTGLNLDNLKKANSV